MPRKKIKSATDQRPFTIVYNDFLESDFLETPQQKLIYIYLKKFADSRGQCYPSHKTLARLTGISESKVRMTLKELEGKEVIKCNSRKRGDGGSTSNLYTLYDYAEMWNSGPMIEKEPDPVPAKEQDQALKDLNYIDIANNTPKSRTSQERYTLDQIKELYDYDVMVYDNPYLRSEIDATMNVLHTALNITKSNMRIGGEDKPTMVAVKKLICLKPSEIIYAIEKYRDQTERIKNPTAYMLTLLYNAPEQMALDITNQVQHDMAHD